MRERCVRVWCILLGMICAVSGCADRELTELGPCLVHNEREEIDPQSVDKADVLFIVDNSHSMVDEQLALRDQLPRLVEILATGELDGDPSQREFTPIADLHLGVVTTNMGAPGLGIASCDRNDGRGDDGQLVGTVPTFPGGSDASFIWFRPPPEPAAEAGAASQVAADFDCHADVGTDGCGIEQQLEAALKALAPPDLVADVIGPAGQEHVADGVPEPARFRGPGGVWEPGHGGATGANAGFLRPDSLLTVILVTDEEDCSTWTGDHLRPLAELPENHPARQAQHAGEINLRCFESPWAMYPVARYVNGLRALRPPDLRHLVIFAAIAGVPPDLVEDADFTDEAAREQLYEEILAHPDMEERVDPESFDGPSGGTLEPVCTSNRPVPDGASQTGAKPARRITQVAQGFGAQGVIQSICQDEFDGALDAIIRAMSEALGDVCLARELPPDVDGKVACDVRWTLRPPEAATEDPNALVRCDQRPFLRPPAVGPAHDETGRAICVVDQVGVDRVSDPEQPRVRPGRGWYYDDFDPELAALCPRDADPQRITFTAGDDPPSGITVRLECLSETQALTRLEPSPGDPAPKLGISCAVDGEAACAGDPEGLRLACHPHSRRCVIACDVDAECPPAWVCDRRDPSFTFCVNPTCGDEA